MKVGLFFGSFNPVHIGHMLIADYLIHNSDLDQIWMVVSPHNPLKTKKSLAKDYDRLHLVQLATEDNPGIKASRYTGLSTLGVFGCCFCMEFVAFVG